MTRKELAREICRWEDPDCEGVKCLNTCEEYKNYYTRADWIKKHFVEKEKYQKIKKKLKKEQKENDIHNRLLREKFGQ